MSQKRYEYLATLRPIDTFTMPRGLIDRRPAKDPKRYPFGVAIFAKPLSRADIEHFSLVPLSPADPINIRRARDLFKEDVIETFSRLGGFGAESRSGKVLLAYSTRPGVEYQLTYFDADETPTSHLNLNDFDEAIGELWGLVLPGMRQSYSARAVPDA